MRKRGIITTAIVLIAILTLGVSFTGKLYKESLEYYIYGKPTSYISIPNIVFTEDTDRTGEGTCLFANGMPIGMATPGDCQGIKMEFDYGVTPDTTGNGKTATGLIIKMVLDANWDFATNPRNAVIRGAMLHAESEGNVAGRVQGAYINAKASGIGKTLEGYFAAGATSAGLISIEARTELSSNATITTPRVVGLLCYHHQKTGSELTGEYSAIQIDQPLTGTISGDMYGIYFTDDHVTGYPFTYAFGFDTNLDNNQIADYNASFATPSAFAVPDGFIKVDIDGTAQYIYTYTTKPAI